MIIQNYNTTVMHNHQTGYRSGDQGWYTYLGMSIPDPNYQSPLPMPATRFATEHPIPGFTYWEGPQVAPHGVPYRRQVQIEDLQLQAAYKALLKLAEKVRNNPSLAEQPEPETQGSEPPRDKGPGCPVASGSSNGCDDLLNIIVETYKAFNAGRRAYNAGKYMLQVVERRAYNVRVSHMIDQFGYGEFPQQVLQLYVYNVPWHFEAHHLNQNMPFRHAIPTGEGVSVLLDKEAHRIVHEHMREFWNRHHHNKSRPTHNEYDKAMKDALAAAGCSDEVVEVLGRVAETQRRMYGLHGSEKMPDIPRH